MSRDAEKKQALLADWWAEFVPNRTIKLLDQLTGFAPAAVLARLGTVSPEPSVYVLFCGAEGQGVPVYVGKADDPISRWKVHLEGLQKGQRSYARWRADLLDADGRAAADLTLLVVP